MGAADVVPGVSGGTMAFILGIYEELLEAIRSLLSPRVLRPLVELRLRAFWNALPWRFLLALGAGILLAILTLARILEWLLVNYPALVWSFFFGLVAASVITVAQRVRRWTARTLAGVALGTVVAYAVVGLVPAETPDAPWFLFLSGFVAICAMILPGISGSFILVLLGKYQFVLSAVNDRNLGVLAFVAAGAAVGIVSFAQFLGWLFRRDHDLTVSILIGFMVGSLRKIWPWKTTVRTVLDRHGEPIPVEQFNVLPQAWDVQVTLAVGLALVGFAVVFALDRVARGRVGAAAGAHPA